MPAVIRLLFCYKHTGIKMSVAVENGPRKDRLYFSGDPSHGSVICFFIDFYGT